MKFKNVFKYIFSAQNKKMKKVIYILGFKFTWRAAKIFQKRYYPLKIDEKKIVFSNFKGGGYGCNPKYIAEEILRRKLPYKLVWLIKKENRKDKTIPQEIVLRSWNKICALKELATAKIWIDNQRKNYHIKNGLRKKKKQIYINTWHGSLGIKKIGTESNVSDLSWVPYAIKDAEMLNYLISNSSFETEVYKRNFWNKGNILELGHPRNDIFFIDNTVIKQKIKERYGIDEDKKILLYIPSFRDNEALSAYGLEYKELKKVLDEKFGGDWLILVRLHPNLVKFQQQLLPQRPYIVNVTDYPDIQELLVVADAAITDYSSCIFDFMLSRKPAFIYASDVEDFDEERGFYYPLTATPFPVAENNEQLRQNILNFDLENYQKRVEKFLKEKGCIEDGHAAERVVDFIEQIMRGEL